MGWVVCESACFSSSASSARIRDLSHIGFLESRLCCLFCLGSALKGYLSLFSFFWTRNGRAPSGVTSEATQHCCENNCHNIHYHDQSEQTVKERHLVAGKLSSKRNKFRQSGENGTMVNPLFSSVQTERTSYLCACQTHYWGHRGTSTSVPSVSKTPVTTIRRHHSTPSSPPGHHRRHRSHQTTNDAIDSHRSHPSHQFLPLSLCTLL